MKKTACIILSLVFLLSAVTFTGCNATTGNSAPASSNAPASSSGVPSQSAAPAPVASWTPEHDITIRVSIAAGDTMDTITRLVSQAFNKTYGTTVYITNMPGAGGAIAANDLLSAKPDPCEMATGGVSLFTLAPLFSADIDVKLDDWRFVCGLTSEDFCVIVNANSGMTTWDEIVAFSKEKRLLVGTRAAGGAVHMLVTALCGESGVEWEGVTSDSTGKDVLACASGEVTMTIVPLSACVQFIEEGSVVPVMSFGSGDTTSFAGATVPTAKSLGYDIQWTSLNYIMTRKEVAQDTVDQMYKAISEYCATDEFLKACETANVTPYICDGQTCFDVISNAETMTKEIYDKYYS